MPVLLLLVARILACESQRFICRRLGENRVPMAPVRHQGRVMANRLCRLNRQHPSQCDQSKKSHGKTEESCGVCAHFHAPHRDILRIRVTPRKTFHATDINFQNQAVHGRQSRTTTITGRTLPVTKGWNAADSTTDDWRCAMCKTVENRAVQCSPTRLLVSS